MLRKMNLMNMKLNDIATDIECIKTKKDDGLEISTNEDLIPIWNMFPLSTAEQLKTIEDFLCTPNNKTLLVRILFFLLCPSM